MPARPLRLRDLGIGAAACALLGLAGCRGDARRAAGDGADSLAGVAHAAPRPAASVAERAWPADWPTDTAFPDGPLGVSVRRGRAILMATRDSLPAYVGNDLRCTSCHLDEGRRPGGIPWVGVYGRFPQYRSRSARVLVLEDRINDCLRRSLHGRALPPESRAMRDMVAYMAWLSRGIPVGATVSGQGLPRMEALAGDGARGEGIFAGRCASCHGADGQGTLQAPPLWGPRSFNVGAGMARLRTAAAFIRHNMPYDRPGTLTDQQAFDVAAFVTSRPRPDFPGKERDWPKGGAPPDVPYRTRGAAPND
jgi:thiosulfate dehydrogenase